MTENSNKKVVTRFAPSPTGVLHVGSARTALFNYLFAKQQGGTCILRIEDTDKERSKKEFEEDIKEGLAWLGITFDAEYRQSDRTAIYKDQLEQLIKAGHAYVSKEEAAEEGKRSEVIRFKNPNKRVSFEDAVRGTIEFDTTELGDFVIAKDLETPLYNFVVVVDDHLMGITHVIRGEDGISNTPRQILIQEAIGASRPTYVHIPLILAPDRSKLSKRHGAVSVLEYRAQGYRPEAIVNFLALIGWNPGTDQEVFSMSELVEAFSLEKIHKSGAIFNVDKLNWLNAHYLGALPEDEKLSGVCAALPQAITGLPGFNKDIVRRALSTLLERIHTFSDITRLAEEGELIYFFKAPAYDADALLWKKDPDRAKAHTHLTHVLGIVSAMDDSTFTKGAVKDQVWEYAEQEGRGDVLWPMRYALSGKDKSPDPFELCEILGKTETCARLEAAIDKLS